MSSRRLTVVAASCLLVAVGLGIWNASSSAGPDGGATASDAEPEAPTRRSKWFWQSDEAPAAATPAPVARPVGVHQLRVVDEAGKPVAQARVEVRASPLLDAEGGREHGLVMCDDFRHLTRSAERARSGDAAPRSIAQAVTDEHGVATFERSAWPAEVLLVVERGAGGPRTVVAVSGDLGLGLGGGPDGEDPSRVPEVELAARLDAAQVELAVLDTSGAPLLARVTSVDLAEGRALVDHTDRAGLVRLMAGAARLAFVEVEGFFPHVVELDPSTGATAVMLSRTGTVELTAPEDLGVLRVELLKRHRRPVTLTRGRATVADEPAGRVRVEVADARFLGDAQGQLDEGGTLRLALQVKRVGRLFVTVVDAMGLPVPAVTASLATASTAVTAEATEEGQRLELGPIGEGPGVLSVSAPGFVSRNQSVEIGAGDAELEVTLVAAPTLRGRVVDASGAPVADVAVQIRTELPNDPDGAVSAADGTFTLHVEEPGTWEVETIGVDERFARATAQVPGPDVVLRLEPLGELVVTVLGPDGKPPPSARALLANADSPEPDFGEPDETGELRFVGLVAGDYRLEIDDGEPGGGEFVRHRESLHLASGETRRLTVRLVATVTLEGTLVDAQGKPVAGAVISPKGDAMRSAETGDDGTFSIPGLAPDTQVELELQHERAVACTPSSVRATAARQVLTAVFGEVVSGRVVDPEGTPVVEFFVNGAEQYTLDGRFEVPVGKGGSLEISGLDGAPVRVPLEGRRDVGDVVLTPGPALAGLVVDEAGQPVAGVQVTSAAFVFGAVESDARGRFEARLLAGQAAIVVQARHGELGALVELGARVDPVTIVLTPPTRVEGLVRGSGGRPVATSVIARGEGEQEYQVDTDAQGRFTLALQQGTWLIGTRASRSSAPFRISGRTARVELGGASERCELTVRGLPMPSGALLVPNGVPFAPDDPSMIDPLSLPSGAIALGTNGGVVGGRELPCGPWQLHAFFGEASTMVPVVLGPGPNVITVNAPQLAGASSEMRITVPSAFLAPRESDPHDRRE